MNLIDSEGIEQSLRLLGELVAEHPPQHYVVCGGSSLIALGLIRRITTKDVDVLARVEDGELVCAKPLPPWMSKAIERIGDDLGLKARWFNTGPSDDSFFRHGLPEGLAGRLTTREYGPSLRISFISRVDQIHLKLYAAADQDVGRHFRDLKDLNPTRDELINAARWTRTQDPSEGFCLVLGNILKALGHADLIGQV